MRKLIRDIHRGKDIEKNLPRYVEYAISTYEEYGMLELTFSAYSLVEQIVEEAKELAEKESGSVDRVLAALGELGQKD
jgi:hypothetical protein